jgi:hypothetical protein
LRSGVNNVQCSAFTAFLLSSFIRLDDQLAALPRPGVKGIYKQCAGAELPDSLSRESRVGNGFHAHPYRLTFSSKRRCNRGALNLLPSNTFASLPKILFLNDLEPGLTPKAKKQSKLLQKSNKACFEDSF